MFESQGIQLNENSELSAAIEAISARGDNRVLHMLLDIGSRHRPTAVEWLGSSLHAAISKNRHEIAAILLDAGAQPEMASLLQAIKQKNADIVRKLLAAGAPVNKSGDARASTTTVLPEAVSR